jgi:hypothetical protein
VSADASSAQVVIKRERAWSGSLLPWTVWLDGQKAGTLHVGGSLTIATSPGQHDISLSAPGLSLASLKSDPFRFDVAAGGRIDLVTQASVMTGRPRVWHRGLPPSQLPLTGRLKEAAAQWQKNWPAAARADAPVPAEPVSAAPETPAITSTVVEGSRYEVPLGEESRTVDNSKSSSPTTRVVRLTREWARTCTVDVERDMTVRGSAGLRIGVLDLKAEAERMLRTTYSVTSEERETFAEEVTLNVAKRTKSEIIFFWKEIRQKGIVRISGAGFEARVPYEVAVGLTFDQQQIDTP